MAYQDDAKNDESQAILAENARLSKQKNDFDTIRQAIGAGLLTENHVIALSHAFQLQLGASAHQTDARDHIVSNIADTVRGKVDEYRVAAEQPKMLRFADQFADSLLKGLNIAPNLAIAATGLVEKGLGDTHQVARTIAETIYGDPDIIEAHQMGTGGAGQAGQVAGSLAALGIAFYAGGPASLESGAGGFLGRTIGGSGTKLALLGGGLSAGVGASAFALYDTDRPTIDRLNSAMSWAGGTLMAYTALLGRPLPEYVGAVRRAEVLGALGKQTGNASWAYGQMLTNSPRLLLGNMVGAATMGAAYVASEEVSRGTDGFAALGHGIAAGFNFAGWDAAFAGIGGIGRIIDYRARAAKTALGYYSVLGLGVAATGAVTTGAAELVGIASGQDQDSILMEAAFTTGAVGIAAVGRGVSLGMPRMGRGGVAGRLAAQGPDVQIASAIPKPGTPEFQRTRDFLAHKLRSVLPANELEKVFGGQLQSLSKESLGAIAGTITDAAWRQAIMEGGLRPVEQATGNVAARATGPVAHSIEQADLSTKLSYITQEMGKLQAQGISWTNPQYLKLATLYGSVLDELQTMLPRQAARRVGIPLDQLDDFRKFLAPLERVSRELNGRMYLPQTAGPSNYGGEFTPARVYGVAANKFEAARVELKSMPMPKLIDEATSRLGMSRAEVKRLMAANVSPEDARGVTWLRERIAILRTRGDKPVPVERPPAPPEWAATPGKLVAARTAVESLAADANATDAVADGVLKNFLGATVKRSEAGVGIRVPGLGTVRAATLRNALDELKGRLGDLSVPAIAAPGFAIGRDEDDGGAEVSWLPNAATAAMLGGLGMILVKGKGIRVKGLVRNLRGALGMMSEKFGAEGIFVARADGKGSFTTLSQRNSVDFAEGLGLLKSGEAKYPSAVFSWHNHPGPLADIKEPSRHAFTQMPSPEDIAVAAAAAAGKRGYGAILTRGDRALVFDIPTITGGHTFGGVKAVDSRATNLYDVLVLAIRGARTDFAMNLQKETGVAAKTVGEVADNFIRMYGEDAFLARADKEIFAPFDIKIYRNVTDRDMESFIAKSMMDADPSLGKRLIQPDAFVNTQAAPALAPFMNHIFDLTSTEEGATFFRELAGGKGVVPASVKPFGEGPVLSEAARSVRRPLPESMPPTAASGPVASWRDLKTAAAERGLEVKLVIDNATGRLRYTATQDGNKVMEAATVTELRHSIDNYGPEKWSPEAGRMRTRGAATLAGTIVGGLAGGFVGAWSQWGNGENDHQGALWTGFASGALLGAIGTAKLIGLADRALANKVYKRFMPALENIAPSGAQLGKEGIKQETFRAWSDADQYSHVIERMRHYASAQNMSAEDRLGAIKGSLTKFVPRTVTAPQLDNLILEVRNAGKAAKLNSLEQSRLVRGYLNQFGVDPSIRNASARINLLNLRREPTGNFSDIAGIEKLRDAILAADVVSGPMERDFMSVSDALKHARDATIPSSASDVVRKLYSVLDEPALQAMGGRGSDVLMMGGLLAKFRPTMEALRTEGNSLVDRGEADGQILLRLVSSIENFIRTRQNLLDDEHRIFKGYMGNIPQKDWNFVRWAKEGDGKLSREQWREKMADRPEIIDAANRMDAQFERLAKWVGLPEEIISKYAIEGYFPHLYSQRTIAQLRRDGLLTAEPLIDPIGIAIPKSKFFRSMMPRTSESPLGPMLDTFDASNAYLWGIVNKGTTDALFHAVDFDALRDMVGRRPTLVKRATNLLMDIHGTPSEETVAARSFINNLGVDLEGLAEVAGFNGSEFFQGFMDHYWDLADPTKISRGLRTMMYVTKIGGSLTSAMMQLSQAANTVPELGFFNTLAGGIRGLGAKIAEVAPPLAPIFDPTASGVPLIRVAREAGVFSEKFQSAFTDFSNQPLFGGNKERALAWALNKAVTTVGFMHSAGETFNRTTVAFGSDMALKQAAKITSPGARRAYEIADTTALGAASGAAVGFTGNPDDRLKGAAVGSAIGAGLGAATGMAGRPLLTQVERSTTRIAENFRPIFPTPEQMAAGLKPTQEEVAKLYMAQVTNMTQFGFGKHFRPEIMRNPMFEPIFALQGFTLQQAEFTGSRMRSWFESMTGTGTGDWDLRILKHGMMLGAVASGLTALAGFVGNSEKSPEYWGSRIGFGLLFFVRWNEAAGTWQVEDPYQSVGRAAILGDIYKTTNTIYKLMTDDHAREEWFKRLDGLARNLVSFMRQGENYGEALGKGLELAGAERAADAARAVGQFTSQPFSTMTGNVDGGGVARPAGNNLPQSMRPQNTSPVNQNPFAK